VLAAIAEEVRACTRCRLAERRTHAVPGEGSPDTEVVFVGEGPGFNEDQQGRPFVGAAGSLLDELIGAVGWRRSDVFITNVVKCRPPDNRDPEPDEMAACAPFLRRQLEVLDPALVVTLGRFSLGTFMPRARIGQVHGTVHPVDPATGARSARAFAMYHPAAALRQGVLKETMRDDMSRVPAALIASRQERAAQASVADADAHPPGLEQVPMAEPVVTAHAPGTSGDAASAAASATAGASPPPPIVATGGPPAADIVDALETLDALAPLEVLDTSLDQPPETDQMRLFR
jgi:uracil-DNA glycosylase